MPLEDLHREVAAVVLRAVAPHGFALAGGCALIAHGIIDRPTQDVDLFTNHERGVEAAASAVEQGLRAAGFQAERRDKAGGLADVFPGLGEGLAEWIVISPGCERMLLLHRGVLSSIWRRPVEPGADHSPGVIASHIPVIR